MTPPHAFARALRRWLDRTGDPTVLAIVRIAIGIFLFKSALDAGLQFERVGFFGDHFHMPFDIGIAPEHFVLGRSQYLVLIVTRVLLAVLVTIGLFARPALLVTSILGVYVLLCDRLQFHHNRYSLLCYAFLLSLTPCDKRWAIGGDRESGKPALLWAVPLVMAQVSLIYVASGGSKLLDPDWRDGTVMGLRLFGAIPKLRDIGAPESVIRWVATPSAGSFAAKGAIITELFLAVGLWVRPTRVVALWWGILFHLWIELTAKVELFSWLTIAMYAVFATHDVHARKVMFDPTRASANVIARLIALLDWFARFEIKKWTPDPLKEGHAIVIVRRDGSFATGIYALLMATRCLPALFPLWAPMTIIVWFVGKEPLKINE